LPCALSPKDIERVLAYAVVTASKVMFGPDLCDQYAATLIFTFPEQLR
jgi:hypothetical protein